MSENLSANYYQENNWWLQEKVCEKYQNLSEEQKKESNNMVMNVTKIYQKMKSKSFLNIEKNIIEWEKMLCYNYKKVF